MLRSLVALLCRDDRLVWDWGDDSGVGLARRHGDVAKRQDRLVWDWGVSFDVLRIAVIKGARWASNLMSSRQSETTRDLEIFRCAQYDRGELSI